MDARKSVICGFQFVKLILKTITYLIQYMVLEIQLWSVKCTTITVRYAKISKAFLFLPIKRCKRLQRLAKLYENKPLQNVYKRV